ncbi:protein amnionless [Lutzomyia longipalpis]|uniref:protein amnionless n=1 Tax=Lutzomyia longipalpis TaxID=7200 RepID=UPI002484118E|nr:protein amnionless [Lutzomyia longipalpis]
MLRDFLLLCLVSNFMVPAISSGIKQWVPNFSFTDPRMWTQAHLPCADQLILFPAYFYTALDLPQSLTIRGTVLPIFGALTLPSSGQINFNNDPATNCEASNSRDTVAIFKRPERHFWLLSHNWREIDQDGAPMRINKAIPHLDRIPCTFDEVRFPQDRNFVVDLQLTPRVDFAIIQLHAQYVQPMEFERFLLNRDGQMMFKNGEMVRVRSDQEDTEESPCHAEPFQYSEVLLCQNEKDFCEVPQCLNPIKPRGFCCDICGASLLMDMQKNHLSLKILRNVIDPNLRSLGEAHEIDYFLGIVVIEGRNFIQLVITDVEEYDEKSTKVMKALQNSIIHPYAQENVNLTLSGRPYKPSERRSFWNFIFLPFLSVISALLLIYAYYYKIDDGKLHVLTWEIPIPPPERLRSIFTSWNSQFIFARFENTRDDGETSIAELQIHPGTSTTNPPTSPSDEVESQIQLVTEEKQEDVENLLNVDLDH